MNMPSASLLPPASEATFAPDETDVECCKEEHEKGDEAEDNVERHKSVLVLLAWHHNIHAHKTSDERWWHGDYCDESERKHYIVHSEVILHQLVIDLLGI